MTWEGWPDWTGLQLSTVAQQALRAVAQSVWQHEDSQAQKRTGTRQISFSFPACHRGDWPCRLAFVDPTASQRHLSKCAYLQDKSWDKTKPVSGRLARMGQEKYDRGETESHMRRKVFPPSVSLPNLHTRARFLFSGGSSAPALFPPPKPFTIVKNSWHGPRQTGKQQPFVSTISHNQTNCPEPDFMTKVWMFFLHSDQNWLDFSIVFHDKFLNVNLDFL